MPVAQSLDAASFSDPQSELNNLPTTIASAATIAPRHKFTIVTGTTQLVTITPPQQGFHVLYLVFPDAMGAFATSGNILVGADPGVNIPVAMYYDPRQQKYYPGPIS